MNTHKNTSVMYDLTDIREMCGNDKVAFAEMIDTFIKTCLNSMDNIKLAVEREDWNALSHYAHKLAGPCNHLQINELYQLLKELEFVSKTSLEIEKVNEKIIKASAIINEVIRQLTAEKDE